jgi:hypothetical protein
VQQDATIQDINMDPEEHEVKGAKEIDNSGDWVKPPIT